MTEKANKPPGVSISIPKKSAGRLVDALTDIIRPFSEARGLKGDQIRLQREEVLIEIAERATRRLAVEGRQPSPVSNKFLVPFLEKASLEELDSALVDMWANLLASASSSRKSTHLRYIGILSELDKRQAHLLEAVVLNNINQFPDYPLAKHEDLEFDFSERSLEYNLANLSECANADAVFESLHATLDRPGIVVGLFALEDPATGDFWTDGGSKIYNDELSLDLQILQGHGFLRRIDVASADIGKWKVGVIYDCVTPLGFDFWLSCSSSEAAQTAREKS